MCISVHIYNYSMICHSHCYAYGGRHANKDLRKRQCAVIHGRVRANVQVRVTETLLDTMISWLCVHFGRYNFLVSNTTSRKLSSRPPSDTGIGERKRRDKSDRRLEIQQDRHKNKKLRHEAK
jgi:hypothetical protein